MSVFHTALSRLQSTMHACLIYFVEFKRVDDKYICLYSWIAFLDKVVEVGEWSILQERRYEMVLGTEIQNATLEFWKRKLHMMVPFLYDF